MGFPDERDRNIIRLAEEVEGLATDLCDWLSEFNPSRQATDLLVEVGGLSGLLHAEVCELQAVYGIGVAQATRLMAAVELGRRLVASEAGDRVQVRSPSNAAQVLLPWIGDKEQEHFVVLFLDTRNRIVGKELLYKGSINTSLVRVAEVFRGAVRRHCHSIIVAHNHPSGDKVLRRRISR